MPTCPKCGCEFGEPVKGKVAPKAPDSKSKKPSFKERMKGRNELGVLINKKKQDEISY